ncbi:hypothetical protein EVAR_84450_1 [Eumeta japonica]|uniref:Uncharacterized protein n=1 Tax=Eumeta variegata TaxID=151549 RepID=A0A4C1W388_EUMVA|nr:hypothetical protein EVAR_84450_1 [Eumeta japonica]
MDHNARDRPENLHVSVGCGVEQRLCFFRVLTSDSGYLYACRFKSNREDACVSGALTVIDQVAISKLRAEGDTGRNGHCKSKLVIFKFFLNTNLKFAYRSFLET